MLGVVEIMEDYMIVEYVEFAKSKLMDCNCLMTKNIVC